MSSSEIISSSATLSSTISSFSSDQRTINAILSAAGMPYVRPEASSNSTTLATSTETGSPASNTTTSDSRTPTIYLEAGHGGLPTGAAVGIGVGATLGIVALVLAGFFVLRRRRRRQRVEQSSLQDEAHAKVEQGSSDSEVEEQQVWFKSEKDGQAKYEAPDTSPRLVESGGVSRSELNGKWEAAELDGGWRPAEADGSQEKEKKG